MSRPLPHIFLHRGWWYATEGRGGRPLHGFASLRDLIDRLAHR